MDWRQREKIEPCTCEQVRPNAFRRVLGIFKPRFESIPTCSLAALNNEERKAVEAHQLEVEQKRAVAIMQARHSVFR
jgi:hypothetical protein